MNDSLTKRDSISTSAKHRDDATAFMLLPWTVEGPFPGRKRTKKHDGFAPYANIVNRIGTYVAQGLPPEVAAGIVDAVNGVDATLKLQRTLLGWSIERDRLRDLVRRLADSLGVAVYALRASALFPIPPLCPPHDHLNGVDITALLDEAREAVGESMKEGGEK